MGRTTSRQKAAGSERRTGRARCGWRPRSGRKATWVGSLPGQRSRRPGEQRTCLSGVVARGLSRSGCRPVRGRRRVQVLRPDPAPADTPDSADDRDPGHSDDHGARWVETTITPMGHRLGRWQRVLVEALAEHGAAGLRAVVEGQLGQMPAMRSAAQPSERTCLREVAGRGWHWSGCRPQGE
jgi:hypothetical protein